MTTVNQRTMYRTNSISHAQEILGSDSNARVIVKAERCRMIGERFVAVTLDGEAIADVGDSKFTQDQLLQAAEKQFAEASLKTEGVWGGPADWSWYLSDLAEWIEAAREGIDGAVLIAGQWYVVRENGGW